MTSAAPATVGAPAPWPILGARYAKELVHSALRLALFRVRDRSRVTKEYDQGVWRQFLDARSWEAHPMLESFVEGESGRRLYAKIRGRVTVVDVREYYRYRRRALAALLDELSGGDDHLVELGSGLGAMLFALAVERPGYRFDGFDVSVNGVEAARAIAAHFGVGDRVRFDRLDLLDGAHPGFARILGRTVFTHFCLEQMPRDTERVLRNILAHRPRRVIHIEPTRELLQWWKPFDLLNSVYLRSRDYQSSLFRSLEGLEARGEIRVLRRGRLPFAPTFHNDGFIAVWEPRDRTRP